MTDLHFVSQSLIEEKASQLTELHRQLEHDEMAPLYPERIRHGYRPVFGEGRPTAQIIFIGEAPGAREAVFGRPFIGAAGHLLHDLLKMEKIERRCVYLTNLIKDRLPSGRKPMSAEVEYYANYLECELDILKPLLLAPMGKLAMDYVLTRFRVPHESARVTDLHGHVLTGRADYGAVRIVPLLHPSAALYDTSCLHTLAHDFRMVRAVATELWLLD